MTGEVVSHSSCCYTVFSSVNGDLKGCMGDKRTMTWWVGDTEGEWAAVDERGESDEW